MPHLNSNWVSLRLSTLTMQLQQFWADLVKLSIYIVLFPVSSLEFGQHSEKLLAHTALTFSSINLMESQLHGFCTHIKVRAASLETEICQVRNYKTMIGVIKSINNNFYYVSQLNYRSTLLLSALKVMEKRETVRKNPQENCQMVPLLGPHYQLRRSSLMRIMLMDQLFASWSKTQQQR